MERSALSAAAWKLCRNEYDKAVSDCSRALAISPKLALAYCYRGFAYAYSARYEQAFIDFDKALALDPELAYAYFGKGYVYSQKPDYAKAWENINRAQELGYSVPEDFLARLKQASGRDQRKD